MTNLSVPYAGITGPADAPLRLRGTLSTETGPPLLHWLRLRRTDGMARVVIDLSEVTHVDRDGADALLDAYVATTLRAGTLVLTGLTRPCREALETFGVLEVLDVVDSPGRHS